MAEVEDFVKEPTIDKLLSYKRDIIFDIASNTTLSLAHGQKNSNLGIDYQTPCSRRPLG